METGSCPQGKPPSMGEHPVGDRQGSRWRRGIPGTVTAGVQAAAGGDSQPQSLCAPSVMRSVVSTLNRI